MKFNNCDLDMQLKKQRPKSVIQVSCSSLQGDCTKETVPHQRGLPRHCTTHSCEIILSKCVNMQNRSLMHFSWSPLHDCNVPPPPSVQLNQQNSAAQTPPGSRHATPFPRQKDSKIHARLQPLTCPTWQSQLGLDGSRRRKGKIPHFDWSLLLPAVSL